MRFERFLEFPLVRIALGLLLTIVLILPAQVLASGASAVSVRGALAELYTAVAELLAAIVASGYSLAASWAPAGKIKGPGEAPTPQ